jgi:hypothetical protein
MRGSNRTTFSHALLVRQALDQPIPATLDSSNSRVANRLISIWEVDDLRYDISAYGEYFRFIPRRLGTSLVLDAAVRAFVCAYPTVHTGQPSTEALAAYGTAIRLLGRTLRHPTQRHEPSTLMSLHIIQKVQSWVDKPTDPYADHTVVIAHLLPAMIAQEWTDPIDRYLLLISATLIIVTATGSSKIPLPVESLIQFFQKWLPPRPFTNRDGAPLETMALDRALSIPIWSRAPLRHVAEMREFYQQALVDLAVLQDRTKKLLPDGADAGEPDELAMKLSKQHGITLVKIYVHMQIGCSIGLSTAIFLNATLRAMEDPVDHDTQLILEAERLNVAALQLAEEMKIFLPLYASGVSMPLACAWAVETDPSRSKRLREMLQIYQTSSGACNLVTGGMWLKRYLAKLREQAVTLAAGKDYSAAVRAHGAQESFHVSETNRADSRCTIL